MQQKRDMNDLLTDFFVVDKNALTQVFTHLITVAYQHSKICGLYVQIIDFL